MCMYIEWLQEAGRILTLQTGTINSDKAQWGSLSVPCCPCLSVAQAGLQLLASGDLSASVSWADGLVTLPLLLALSASNSAQIHHVCTM